MEERIVYLKDEFELVRYKKTEKETIEMAKSLEAQHPETDRIKINDINDALEALSENWGIHSLTRKEWNEAYEKEVESKFQ